MLDLILIFLKIELIFLSNKLNLAYKLLNKKAYS
jgi:hypothetical protein